MRLGDQLLVLQRVVVDDPAQGIDEDVNVVPVVKAPR